MVVANANPTEDTLVTPDQAEVTTKANTAAFRRTISTARARKKAVATDPKENAIDALSTELGINVTAGNRNLLAVVAATDTVVTPVVATNVAAMPKRRRLEVAVAPPAIVTPVRAEKKCEGCIHADLLELNGMTPAHIKHYVKPNMFLEDAVCAECHESIRRIHQVTPKVKLHYCDMMIKGFSAPDNDREKASMECGLVLCVPCHNIRMKRYDMTIGSNSNGRPRRRGRNSY
jgi:hypothetical protein